MELQWYPLELLRSGEEYLRNLNESGDRDFDERYSYPHPKRSVNKSDSLSSLTSILTRKYILQTKIQQKRI